MTPTGNQGHVPVGTGQQNPNPYLLGGNASVGTGHPYQHPANRGEPSRQIPHGTRDQMGIRRLNGTEGHAPRPLEHQARHAADRDEEDRKRIEARNGVSERVGQFAPYQAPQVHDQRRATDQGRQIPGTDRTTRF